MLHLGILHIPQVILIGRKFENLYSVEIRAVILNVWLPDWQQQQHLETCPTLDLQNQQLGVGDQQSILTSPPGDSDTQKLHVSVGVPVPSGCCNKYHPLGSL